MNYQRQQVASQYSPPYPSMNTQTQEIAQIQNDVRQIFTLIQYLDNNIKEIKSATIETNNYVKQMFQSFQQAQQNNNNYKQNSLEQKNQVQYVMQQNFSNHQSLQNSSLDLDINSELQSNFPSKIYNQQNIQPSVSNQQSRFNQPQSQNYQKVSQASGNNNNNNLEQKKIKIVNTQSIQDKQQGNFSQQQQTNNQYSNYMEDAKLSRTSYPLNKNFANNQTICKTSFMGACQKCRGQIKEQAYNTSCNHAYHVQCFQEHCIQTLKGYSHYEYILCVCGKRIQQKIFLQFLTNIEMDSFFETQLQLLYNKYKYQFKKCQTCNKIWFQTQQEHFHMCQYYQL